MRGEGASECEIERTGAHSVCEASAEQSAVSMTLAHCHSCVYQVLSPADNRVVRLGFQASEVPKRDLMSQSDPYVMAWKLRAVSDGKEDWVPVFKTEVGHEGGGGQKRAE